MEWINGQTKLSKATMEKFEKDICNMIYPVGSYYWSSESTDPSTLFGGTWEQVKDKFILALGDNYTTAGATGGNASTTLQVTNLPSHSHPENSEVWVNTGGSNNKFLSPTSSGSNYFNTKTVGNRGDINTGATGNATPFSNMPPYEVAYCWKRTA